MSASSSPEEAPEEALAGGADEHGPAERDDLVQAREELEVVLHGLAEADAGVEADALLVDPGVRRGLEPLLEERLHLGDDVVVARVVLHRPRLAEHVHEAEAGVRVGDDAGELRVAAQRGDVVDHHRAGLERHAARPRPSRCRWRPARPESAASTGSTRRSSSSSRDPLRARAGRLAADVDDRRAFVEHSARPAIAACGCRNAPPSENESGVTLTTPMTLGRGRSSSIAAMCRDRRTRGA